MITEDQAAVIDFLASPSTHGGAAVERIDTHSAIVFLAGPRAWKLKRAVRFDYLDFSTADRRKTMSEAEVELNRRTAPTIYRGVVPVTRASDSSLALNGHGTPVDWLVEMNRFDERLLLDRLAEGGILDVALMRALASAIARFHAAARHRTDHGGNAGMQWVIEGNAAGFAEFGANLLEPSASIRVTLPRGQRSAATAGYWTLDKERDSYASATETSTSVTSSSSMASRRCSTQSSSTTRSPAST